MKILTDIDLIPTAAGDILVGGTNVFDRLAIGTTGQVLTVVGGTPNWAAASGTAASGLTNPMTTLGDIIYAASGGVTARLGIGTTGQVLTVVTGIPGWADDAAGSGTKPAFSVHKNGTNQTGLASATFTKLTWPTEEFDTNSNFASDKFTPTVAGKYDLHAALGFITSTSLQLAIITFYKNGARYKDGPVAAAGAGSTYTSVHITADANGSTDYFEVYAYHNFTGTRDIDGGSTVTYFTGCKID